MMNCSINVRRREVLHFPSILERRIILEKKTLVCEAVEALAEEMYALNQWMYDNPELGFQEYQASSKLVDALREAGFSVEAGVAGMETAFVARYKGRDEGPKLALFAEYDALPNIGHACGHNIIAVSALGAAISLVKAWPDMPGELIVFGSPAEEQSSVVDDCGGKVHLVEAGYLEDVDAALMIHPTNHNSAWSNNLAVQPLEMTFYGRTAQPAGSAHLGVNAFEAAVLAYTNINACRQYFEPNWFVHGMITESGPAPNIMSPRSILRLHVRASTNDQLERLLVKVKQCGEAAAAVMGATVEFNHYMVRYREVKNNTVLAELLDRNMRALGLKTIGLPSSPRGSTDMGNVSQVVPAVHGYISLGTVEEAGNTHNPEFAPSTVGSAGRSAAVNAAKAMAMTVVELLDNPRLIADAKGEFGSQS
jgi:amidohydrolase